MAMLLPLDYDFEMIRTIIGLENGHFAMAYRAVACRVLCADISLDGGFMTLAFHLMNRTEHGVYSCAICSP